MAPGKRFTEHPHHTRVRHDNPDHHANRAGLAGAVGSQQAENLALLDSERKIIDREIAVISLAHALEFADPHADYPIGKLTFDATSTLALAIADLSCRGASQSGFQNENSGSNRGRCRRHFL